ncbi:MAG: hypothetical protein H0T79_16955 [Deltaproteobacteria bacterium]|nr:hypothetical protein [Deltaproteobacteria bacterium]
MATKKPPKTKQPPGTERARDEQREDRGPTYGGEDWAVADERGDQRFGHARNDDADPLELVKAGQGQNDDDESPTAADPELGKAEEDAEIESGGQRAGHGRGEEPRKTKDREPKNG